MNTSPAFREKTCCYFMDYFGVHHLKNRVQLRAPSWSWLSVDGPVWIDSEEGIHAPKIEILNVQASFQDPSHQIMRGCIRVRGRLAHGIMARVRDTWYCCPHGETTGETVYPRSNRKYSNDIPTPTVATSKYLAISLMTRWTRIRKKSISFSYWALESSETLTPPKRVA